MNSDDKSNLRQHAEAALSVKESSLDFESLETAEIKEIFHELQVHQIELEMQKETLEKAQQQILESKESYFNLYSNAPISYCTLDETGKLFNINKQFCELLGRSKDEIISHSLKDFIHPDDQDSFYFLLKALGQDTPPNIPELRLSHGEDDYRWCRPAALRQLNNKAIHVLLTLTDTTADHIRLDKIRQLAFYDSLTKLPNRRLFLDRLEHALLSSQRTGKNGALMLLDLDNFKRLNDTHGHAQGDLLLTLVAERLESCLRKGDSIARLGGDEFVVLLENLNVSPTEAALETNTVVQKILQKFEQNFTLQDYRYLITSSIGIAVITPTTTNCDDLLKSADIAMYQAKNDGRNQARFFDKVMQEKTDSISHLETEIREGLLRNEFELFYEKQITHSRKTSGVEALLRWHHPTRGLLYPSDFLGVAENTYLISSLGNFVLKQACKQIKEWAEDKCKREWTVAINVSTFQMKQPGFAHFVIETASKSGVLANKLVLELTETCITDNIETVFTQMRTLEEQGVGLALDDFGTGYSSLSLLKQLPVNQIKIDLSFVKDVIENKEDAAICRATLAMGQSLGIEVLAEGVETESQRDALLDMGFKRFQGYLFGKPVPPEQLV